MNECRQLDLRRIDRALQAIWGKVEAGDVHAIARMIKLMQERAKLLGTYAPEQVSQTLPSGDPMPLKSQEYSEEFIRNVCAIMAQYGLLTGANPPVSGNGTAAESYQR